MLHCDGCKYAKWEKTASGRLHPNKKGRCMYPVKTPILPITMYWMHEPSPYGGWIVRGETLKDHCPCYTKGTYAG